MRPTITVADEAGACYGVDRALEMARTAAASGQGPVYTLGPLIHNPTVVAELETQGVRAIEHAADASGGTILLRTHGVTPEEEAVARATHDVVLNATCPFVIRAHHGAEQLTKEGYTVLILGEPGHPEVEGTLGHAPKAQVVTGADDLQHVTLGRKVGVVVQTTQTRKRLRDLVAALVGNCDELRVIDTICEATTLHQEAAARLAQQVNVMIVIGGRNSANTRRLAEICAARCPKTHHIELPSELLPSWFDGAQHIGISAGASTPRSQIDDVIAAIRKLTEA